MAAQHNQTRRQRYGLVLGVFGAWVAVVSIGAGTQANDSLLGVDHLDIVWMIILAAGALLGLVLLVILNPFSGEWTQPEKQRRGGMWVVLLLALALVMWRPDILDRFTSDEDEPLVGDVFDVEQPGATDEAPVETVAQATDLLLLLTAVAAIGALWFVLKRRQAATASTPEIEAGAWFEADLLATLDQLTAALNSNPDPRTAVLRSYALLESVLASHGSTRAPHETPTEHLRRSLRTIRVDAAPLIRLGELYEVARFSDQPISVEQQRDAARSLEAARRALASRS